MSIFTQVAMPTVKSNSFNMSSDVKMSFNMGQLTPINLIECIPGDRISADSTVMLRFAPLIAPVMHHVDVYTHHFFVPYRILWQNWEKFFVSGVPTPDTPAFPYFSGATIKDGDLGDHLGLPSTPTGLQIDKISAMPFAAYQKIFNDYYRDQNLQEEVKWELTDGANTFADFNSLRRRAWQHDYFTSQLPWAQKGEAVSLPIGSFNDVPVENLPYTGTPQFGWFRTSDNSNIASGASLNVMARPNGTNELEAILSGSGKNINYDPSGNMVAKTSELSAEAVNINALRWAIRLQEYLERNARGGTRYIENVMAQFGVRSSDKRMQRPEFIGGSKNPVVISEVLQTSETSTSPQANMAGHGLSVGRTSRANYFCEEHGYFITLMSVRPKTAYQQGIPRHFSKFEPLSFALPILANLGEQAIPNREIYYDPADVVTGANDETFGYLPRYAEYKYQPSRVAGDMKSSLDFWHFGRKFASRPHLNSSFIECNPTSRPFAVVDEDVQKLYGHIMHNVQMRRLLPKFGIPTL